MAIDGSAPYAGGWAEASAYGGAAKRPSAIEHVSVKLPHGVAARQGAIDEHAVLDRPKAPRHLVPLREYVGRQDRIGAHDVEVGEGVEDLEQPSLVADLGAQDERALAVLLQRVGGEPNQVIEQRRQREAQLELAPAPVVLLGQRRGKIAASRYWIASRAAKRWRARSAAAAR